MKMDLTNVECENVDWIHLALDSVLWWVTVNMVTNVQVP